jgi:hypothetical protein
MVYKVRQGKKHPLAHSRSADRGLDHKAEFLTRQMSAIQARKADKRVRANSVVWWYLSKRKVHVLAFYLGNGLIITGEGHTYGHISTKRLTPARVYPVDKHAFRRSCFVQSQKNKLLRRRARSSE